jgi:3'5'-cyclic nucleotide phosphodiesterase
VLNKIQSSNIYTPRLDLITKNMDEVNKLYIEQGFFDSYASSINYLPEDIQPKNVVEYNMNKLIDFLRFIGEDWNFNTFHVAECSHAPIKVIGKYSIKLYRLYKINEKVRCCIYRLDEIFKISEETLGNFLRCLEEGYLANPYHNSCHGADVMASYMFLITNSCLKRYMNSLEWLGRIIASLAHDLGHPEQQILADLTLDKLSQVRKLIIDMIWLLI